MSVVYAAERSRALAASELRSLHVRPIGHTFFPGLARFFDALPFTSCFSTFAACAFAAAPLRFVLLALTARPDAARVAARAAGGGAAPAPVFALRSSTRVTPSASFSAHQRDTFGQEPAERQSG